MGVEMDKTVNILVEVWLFPLKQYSYVFAMVKSNQTVQKNIYSYIYIV